MTDQARNQKHKRRWVAASASLALVALVAAGGLFQPWKLFLNVTVNEANPIASPAGPGSSVPRGAPSGRPFASIAHSTKGTATVGSTAQGNAVVFIEDLVTDNGPDVKVYLSTVAADGDASSFAREGVNLGDLKGNRGNQAYTIPAGTELSRYRSVVIWCERFSVAFGVAAIDAT